MVFTLMGTPDDDGGNPGACITCALIQTAHERVPANQYYFLELDIHEELARQGFPPPVSSKASPSSHPATALRWMWWMWP
jgi:hypothetical protein